MSRKAQYEALDRLYREEIDRYEALNKRATAYLTIISALSVFAVFKIEAIAKQIMGSPITLAFGFCAGALALAAIVAVAWSMRVMDYHTIIDPRELVLEIDQQCYSEEDVYTLLLAGLVEATSENRRMNDSRARTLTLALWVGVSAAVLVGATNFMIYKLTQ